MKVLHTADWHLGKKLNVYERMPEQRVALESLCSIAERECVDLIVIAGDIYDNTVPSSEAISLFYTTIKRLSRHGAVPIIIIAGNHDSQQAIDAPIPLGTEYGIFFVGTATLPLQSTSLPCGISFSQPTLGVLSFQSSSWNYKVNIITTPYANEQNLRQYFGSKNREQSLNKILRDHWHHLFQSYCDESNINLLTTHLYVGNSKGIAEKESDEEKSINYIGGVQMTPASTFPKDLDYVALGHLHRAHFVDQEHIWYSGSLLQYSLNESTDKKNVLIVNWDASRQRTVSKININSGYPIFRQHFDTVENALTWLGQHQDCYIEVSIKVQEFLTSEARQALHDAHPRILLIQPIPEGLYKDKDKLSAKKSIFFKNTEDAFTAYFKSAYNDVLPSKELLDTLKKVISSSFKKENEINNKN